jgi:putative endonuclease
MVETSATKKWFVYVLRCADGSLYTGVTTDVERRVKEHNGEGAKGKGAKYTKAHRPVKLAHQETVQTRSEAQIREAELRRLSKAEKEKLVFTKGNLK